MPPRLNRNLRTLFFGLPLVYGFPLLFGAALAAPLPASAEPPPTAVKVGLLLPLSGPYAAVGADNRTGIDAAVALANPKVPIEFVTADSKADPTTSVTEFRRLVDVEHVIAVYAMRGPVGMAVNPLSRSMKVPLFGGVGNKSFAAANEYAIQAWSRSDAEGSYLAAQMKKHGLHRVAVLTTEDDWAVSVSSGFQEAFRQGETVVLEQNFAPTDLDFRTVLSQIRSKSPDVIFANLSIGQLPVFFKQLHEQGNHAVVYSNFWAAKPDVVTAAGADAVEGVRFAEMDTRMASLQTRAGGAVSGATLSAYTSVLLLEQALAAHPEVQTAAELSAALGSIKELRTPDGALPVRDRVIEYNLMERIMRAGKAAPLE